MELKESVSITTLSGLVASIHFSASIMAVSSAEKIDRLPFSLNSLVKLNSGIANAHPTCAACLCPYSHLCRFEDNCGNYY